jgi:hypothetical protein
VKLDDVGAGELCLKALNEIQAAVGIEDCWFGPKRLQWHFGVWQGRGSGPLLHDYDHAIIIRHFASV